MNDIEVKLAQQKEYAEQNKNIALKKKAPLKKSSASRIVTSLKESYAKYGYYNIYNVYWLQFDYNVFLFRLLDFWF